jgi:sugar (glycoside-pentoside-hexuronide) transporter
MVTEYKLDPKDRVQPKTLITYTLGAMGDNFIFIMIVTFLMLYYTDYVGLPAAAVGSIFLITRIWDTLSDLIWGVLIDNTHTRIGKFKPFLIIGACLGSIALFATFSVPAMSQSHMLIYAYVTYFLLSTAFTCFDVPLFAMATVVTKDPAQRSRLVLTTRTGAMFGQWVASLVTLPLLKLLGNSWSQVALIYSIFFFVTSMLTICFVKENYRVPKKEPHSPLVYWQLLRNNRPLVMLMGFWIVFNFVISARIGFGMYYFKYVFHSETALASYLGAATFVAAVGAAFAVFFARKIGKRRLTLISSLLLGISCIALYFLDSLPISISLIVIINCIPSFFLGIIGVVLGVMLTDTVEYNEWHTGKRSEGMIFSLNMFQLKLSGAIGGALTGYVLSWVHYVPNIEQTPLALAGINWSFTILPGILFLLMVGLLFNYKLSEQQCREITTDLHARRNS